MKVTLPKDYRSRFTLEDMEIARKIIREIKDDESKPAEYAEIVVNYIMSNYYDAGYYGCCDRILEVAVEISRNGYRWEPYGEGYKDLDMWMTGVAKLTSGYLEFGMYMSDIWTIGGEYFIPQERVYARLYTHYE